MLIWMSSHSRVKEVPLCYGCCLCAQVRHAPATTAPQSSACRSCCSGCSTTASSDHLYVAPCSARVPLLRCPCVTCPPFPRPSSPPPPTLTQSSTLGGGKKVCRAGGGGGSKPLTPGFQAKGLPRQNPHKVAV